MITLGALVASTVVACGGAQSKGAAAPEAPASTEAQAAPEPTTLDDAKAQLERARAELLGEGATPAMPAEPGPATPSEGADAAETEAGADVAPGSASACRTTCRAVDSMRSAVTAICRLAGDESDDCREAKSTLTRGEARAEGCGC